MSITLQIRKISAVVVFALMLPGMAMASDNTQCVPSKWGPEDELGNINLVNPATVLKAAQLIRTGRTYSLGITIDSSTPAFAPRSLSLQVVQPGQQESARPNVGMTYNDDVFQGWFGIGSQLDGLGHLGFEGMYYNCNHARDFVCAQLAQAGDVREVPCMITVVVHALKTQMPQPIQL